MLVEAEPFYQKRLPARHAQPRSPQPSPRSDGTILRKV
jgi:hypothetical protein